MLNATPVYLKIWVFIIISGNTIIIVTIIITETTTNVVAVIMVVLIPSLQCSSSCWKRIPSVGVSLPWWQQNRRFRIRHFSLCKQTWKRVRRLMERTHWETSAMCLCLRLTHRSSSSCSRTSFSRESPMPLVSYLKRKSQTNTKRCQKHKIAVQSAYPNCKGGFALLVDVILDW